jgi:hypothetical protein
MPDDAIANWGKKKQRATLRADPLRSRNHLVY